MASVSGISAVSKVFSKLGDNSGSVIPMFAKDFTSDTLMSMTYFKEGGNQDGAEKTLEEFGTGILWLGGIPFIKKTLFDSFIYKKKNINPDIDAKKLFANGGKQAADTVEFACEKAKSLGPDFKEQAEILENTVKNKSLAKNLSLGKFAFSTAVTGLALYGVITLKQKRTEKEIEKQVKEKQAKEEPLKNSIKETPVYQMFLGNNKKPKDPSFTGLGTFFMTNPVANTAIVDGVITGTRLTQARKGERFEVGLKEFCQLLFIYGLAQPLQKGLEFVSDKVFKKPISLDYSVLDSKVVKEAIEAEKNQKGSSELLKQAKTLTGISGDSLNENTKSVVDFVFDKKNAKMADVLKKTGDVGVFKKDGKEQLSLLKSINSDKVKKTAQKTVDLIENASSKGQDVTKYLKQTKFLKGAAIIANIGISAVLMGYLQPKLNLFLRKKLHNGDNTNPAIRNLESEMTQKLAFQGEENKDSSQTL